MRSSQSPWVARNSSIYILTSGYIHSSGFVLSHFKRNVKNAWCKLKYGKDQMKKNQTSKTKDWKELLFCPPPNKLPFKKLRGIFWNFFLIFYTSSKCPRAIWSEVLRYFSQATTPEEIAFRDVFIWILGRICSRSSFTCQANYDL